MNHWTGKHHTEETKRKMSLAGKGKIRSEEHRRNLGLAKKGKPNYKTRGENHYKWIGGDVEKICQNCGIKFSISRADEKRGKGKYHNSKCYGETRRGEKNPKWKGGVTKFKKRVRECLEYKRWHAMVLYRDDFTCQKCGKKGGTIHAHHRKSFSILMQEAIKAMPLFDPYISCTLYAPLFDISNGITLCEKCHRKTKSYSSGRKKHD